jgi:hypothetical protein
MRTIPNTYLILFGLLVVAAFTSTCMWISGIIEIVYKDMLFRWDRFKGTSL